MKRWIKQSKPLYIVLLLLGIGVIGGVLYAIIPTKDETFAFQPEFDEERQVINFRQRLENDVKGEIAVTYQHNKWGMAFQLSFFNYGDDIRLFNGYQADCFVPVVENINYAYALKGKHEISVTSEKHSDKYGDWALVNLITDNHLIQDVFMTPLAMKAYKAGKDSGYIFILFVANNKYMKVLCMGSSQEQVLVGECPQEILLQSSPYTSGLFSISGEGPFWHQIQM